MKLLKRCVCILLFTTSLCQAQDLENPNIVFIFCDDLNVSGLGSTADSDVITPNIDSLVSVGRTYYNAHANATICGPSRASVFTGVLPSTSGHFGKNMGTEAWFENPVLSQSKTMFAQMKDEGYKVYASGKLFHASRDPYEDFHDFYTDPFQGPWTYERRAHSDLPQEFSDLKISFSPLESTPVYADGNNGWLVHNQPFFYESEENRDLLGDELSAVYCDSIFELHGNLEEEEPFFLTVGIFNPHSPFHVPQKYFDLYPLEDIDLTDYDVDTTEFAVAAFRNRMNSISNTHIDGLLEASPESDPMLYLKKYKQAYLASVSYVDDVVGDILKSLEEHNLSDDTYIIFSSDHGYHLGSKRIIKKTTLWDGASRIPLIISGPGIAHDSVRTPASLVDVYPTILDMANKPAPDTHVLDGTSLLSSYTATTNTYALIANSNVTPTEIGAKGIAHHQHYAAVVKDYKYILYSSGEDELYNLTEDPGELVDLSSLSERNQTRRIIRDRIQEEVDSLRLPVRSYECLFYGDFEQELNGWYPWEETASRHIEQPSENFDSQHLYLGSGQGEFIKNQNIKLKYSGLYEIRFKASSSSENSVLKLLLSSLVQDVDIPVVDTAFSLTGSVENFVMPFYLSADLHDDQFTFRMDVYEGEGVFLDDIQIVFPDLIDEAKVSCASAIVIPTDIPLSQIPFDTLSSLYDQPDFCTGLSGLALQKWYKIVPESSAGLVIAKIPGESNPVLEIYSSCDDEEALICSDTRSNSLEGILSTGLTPGHEYFLRVGNDSDLLEKQLPVRAYFQNLELINPDIEDEMVFIDIPEYPDFHAKTFIFRIFNTNDPSAISEYTRPVNSDGYYDLSPLNLPDGTYSISVGYTINIKDFQIPFGEGKLFEVGTSEGSVADFLEENLYLMYPNPIISGESSVSIKRISEGVAETVDVILLNGRGTKIQEWRWIDNTEPLDLDLPELPSGLYFMRMVQKNNMQSTTLKLQL